MTAVVSGKNWIFLHDHVAVFKESPRHWVIARYWPHDNRWSLDSEYSTKKEALAMAERAVKTMTTLAKDL